MFEPTNEQGVIWRFAQECINSNIQMKEIRTSFPDAVVVKDNVEYLVEFEYTASNFWAHKHNPMKCDLIVCWVDDWKECPIPVVAISEPNWRNVAWTIPDERDKELDALRHEVERLRRANKRLRKATVVKKKEQVKTPVAVPFSPAYILTSTPTDLRVYDAQHPDASTRTAAAALGVSPSWVSKWRRQNYGGGQ